ncbi:hypothetical protein ACWC8S_24015, partial [Streptomyces fungicidicus]
ETLRASGAVFEEYIYHWVDALQTYWLERPGLGMPAPGGHRFGDDLEAPRVRLSTAPLLGGAPGAEVLDAPDPLELPRVRAALARLGSVFDDLRDDARRWESPR